MSLSNQQHEKRFIKQLILQQKRNSSKTTLISGAFNGVVTTPQQSTTGYLKKTGTALEWDNSYSSNVVDYQERLSVVQGQIGNLQGVFGLEQSYVNLVSDNIPAISNPALTNWSTSADTTQFISDIPSIGANSSMNLFTPLKSGVVFVSFRIDNVGGVGSDILIYIGNTVVAYDTGIAGYFYIGQIMAPVSAGVPFSIQVANWYEPGVPITVELKGFTFLYVI